MATARPACCWPWPRNWPDGSPAAFWWLTPTFANRTSRCGSVCPQARRWGSSCAATLGATVQRSPQPEAARPPVIYPTNLPQLNVLPASAGQNEVTAVGQTFLSARDRQEYLPHFHASLLDRRVARGLAAGDSRCALTGTRGGGALGTLLRRRLSGRAIGAHGAACGGRGRPRAPRQRRPTAGLPGGQIGTSCGFG